MGSVMRRWLCGILFLAVFAALRAEGAEPTVGMLIGFSPVYRYALLRMETGDEPLPQAKTGAVQYKPRDGFFIIAPLNENEEPIDTAHPDQPVRWYLGYTVGSASAATLNSGALASGLSMIDIGANYQEFVYYPDGGSVSQRKAAISVYFSIYETLYVTSGQSGSFISSLRATYLYEHRTAAKTSVVVPGTAGNPDTVNSMVTSFPSAVGALIIHPAVIYEPFETAAYRFAFAPQYTFYNTLNHANPWMDKERLRLEGWLHYFPVADHSFRVQAGLYSDRIVRGETVDGGTELGVMFQLRRDIRPFDW